MAFSGTPPPPHLLEIILSIFSDCFTFRVSRPIKLAPRHAAPRPQKQTAK